MRKFKGRPPLVLAGEAALPFFRSPKFLSPCEKRHAIFVQLAEPRVHRRCQVKELLEWPFASVHSLTRRLLRSSTPDVQIGGAIWPSSNAGVVADESSTPGVDMRTGDSCLGRKAYSIVLGERGEHI